MRNDARTPRELDDRLEEAREVSDALLRQADQLLVASRELRAHSQALVRQLRGARPPRSTPSGPRE